MRGNFDKEFDDNFKNMTRIGIVGIALNLIFGIVVLGGIIFTLVKIFG